MDIDLLNWKELCEFGTPGCISFGSGGQKPFFFIDERKVACQLHLESDLVCEKF